MAVGFALRFYLVLRGGQFFWPDESRYQEAREAMRRMLSGAWHEAWLGLLSRPEHLLFKLLGLIPAAAEQWFGPSSALAAGFFAVFSGLSLWLIGRLVRRMGGTDVQAAFAVSLAVGASSLLYYSRHLLPYDLALFFGLWAWLVAFGRGAGAAGLTGLLASLCFLSYNGYWMLGGGAMIAVVLSAWREGFVAMLREAVVGAFGLALPIGLVVAAGAAYDVDVLTAAKTFSGTIMTVDIGRGGEFIAEHFWRTEGLFGLGLWLILAVSLVVVRPLPRPVLQALWVVLILGVVIWALDGVFRRFIVHGRSIRQVMPFLVIAAGASAGALWARGGWARRFTQGWSVLMAGAALISLRPVVVQWFPQEFREAAAERARALAEAGSAKPSTVAFASFLFTPAAVPETPPPGRILWQRPHPFQFEPYLFEGFTFADREAFRRRDFAMRLIESGVDAAGRGSRVGYPELESHDGYPGAVRLRVRFPADRLGAFEPLVATGESGRGNLIYAIYQDSEHLKIGFDHWGIGGAVSERVPVEWGELVEVVVSMGSLFPPDAPPAQREHLLVTVDGHVVLDHPQAFHPSSPANIAFGVNLIGASTAAAEFTGVIEAVEPASP